MCDMPRGVTWTQVKKLERHNPRILPCTMHLRNIVPPRFLCSPSESPPFRYYRKIRSQLWAAASAAALLIAGRFHTSSVERRDHVGRGASLRIEGRCRRFEDLSSAGWSDPEEWIHRHQGQAL